MARGGRLHENIGASMAARGDSMAERYGSHGPYQQGGAVQAGQRANIIADPSFRDPVLGGQPRSPNDPVVLRFLARELALVQRYFVRMAERDPKLCDNEEAIRRGSGTSSATACWQSSSPPSSN